MCEANACIFTSLHEHTHIINFNRAVFIMVFISHCVTVLKWDQKMAVINGSERCLWFIQYCHSTFTPLKHCILYQSLFPELVQAYSEHIRGN
jgi:hypothetical protein